MTEIPILVSNDSITVGGYTEQVELKLSVGAKGDRGSRIFTSSVDPNTLPPDSEVFGGYTPTAGDIYLLRDTDILEVWEWLYANGEFTWVQTVSDVGGETYTPDPDITAIGNLTGTGILKRTGINTWALDSSSYLTQNQQITLSGDVGGSGTTAISTTLATVNSNVGSFGSATQVGTFTVDAKGRITAAGNTSIAIPQSAVTNLTTDLSNKAPLASPAFTGTPTFQSPSSQNSILVGNSFVQADGSFVANNNMNSLLYLITNGSGSFSAIRAWKANGTYASRTPISADSEILTMEARGWATNYRLASKITLKTGTGTLSDTSMPGAIDFYTTPDGSVTPLVRLTIDQNGLATFSNNVLNTGTGSKYIASQSTDNSGNAYISGANGYVSQIELRTSGTARWKIRKDAASESGSDAGSNFVIQSQGDDNTVRDRLGINRETGKTTLYGIGSTAGLEFGSSGNRIMRGTGSPESAVTAPIGSVWYQTDDATFTVLKWVKLSGTGNTGWYPHFEGRWKSYTPTITAFSGTFTSVSATSSYTQIGKIIHYRVVVTITTNGTAAGVLIGTLPVNSSTSNYPTGSGKSDTTNKALTMWISSATAFASQVYDGTYPGSNGAVLRYAITYEAA